MNTTTKLALVALTAGLLAAPVGMATAVAPPETTLDAPLVDILSDGESCDVGNGNGDGQGDQRANGNACD